MGFVRRLFDRLLKKRTRIVLAKDVTARLVALRHHENPSQRYFGMQLEIVHGKGSPANLGNATEGSTTKAITALL